MFQFFKSLDIVPNLVVHINTFASRNVESDIREYEAIHNLEGVNINRRDMLKDLYTYRANAMREWVEKPMGKSGVRLRKFTNTISVLFPEDTNLETIIDIYINTETILGNYRARDFTPDKLITTISEYLNPEDLKYEDFEDIHQQMNYQMTTGANVKLSETDGKFYLGKEKEWCAVTLTTEKFPKTISAFEFQSAFFDPFGHDFKMALPCPFVCSLVISFEDIEKTKRQTLAVANHNISQLNRLPDELEKQKPILADKKEENENISYYIQKMNEYPLKAQWSLTVYDRDVNDLKRNCTLIKKKFKDMSHDNSGGWILKEESYSPVSYQSFLMGLPLQYSKLVNNNLKRFKILFNSNNAQMAPLLSGNKGFGNKVIFLPERTGQGLSIDFFESKKNQNIIIIGPSGSGKSFLMNEIFISYLGVYTLIRLIDIGDSYKDATKRLGGQFVEADDEKPLCLNFFTNICTEIIEDENGNKMEVVHADELTTIVPIIGYMLKMNLRSSFSKNSISSDDLSRKAMVTILEKAIQVAFERQKRAAGMQTIWEYLKEEREQFELEGTDGIVQLLDMAIIGLQDYVEYTDSKGRKFKGKNWNFFNGVNNLTFDSDLFTFEMEKLTKKGDDIVEIVSMTVLHQIANEAFFKKGVKKLVAIDESAIFLKREMYVDFMDDFSRRIRKYSGMFILLTQYISDFFKTDNAKSLFEGASWKIFLEQEEESIDDATDSGKLSLNDGQIALMKSVKSKAPHYNEFMLRYGGSTVVVLNKVDPFSYWLYTTKGTDKDKILDMEKNYNLYEGEGAWMMGLIATGKSAEEAYSDILKKRA
jgi:conjugal transfer ATP-binding protein TraC